MRTLRPRPRWRQRLARRLGLFPPPLRALPATQRQYQCVCRVKAVNGGRGRRFIWAPWPWKLREGEKAPSRTAEPPLMTPLSPRAAVEAAASAIVFQIVDKVWAGTAPACVFTVDSDPSSVPGGWFDA